MLSIASSSLRPMASCLAVALLVQFVPARSYGQTPKVSVDALTGPAAFPLLDREIRPTAHHVESYGTPQTATPPSAVAPPPPAAAPPPSPAYSPAPQVPVVISPSPTPVMIQPGPTTVLIGQTPPPNIIFAGNAPAAAPPNLMMLAPQQQPAPVLTGPSPQGVTTSANVQYLMAQPAAPPQPQVSAIVLRHPGPICSALGALGRKLSRLGQPTLEMGQTPVLTQLVTVPAPQTARYAPPVEAAPPPPVVAAPEPPRPSPQSEPGHKWRLFRR